MDYQEETRRLAAAQMITKPIIEAQERKQNETNILLLIILIVLGIG
jgi:hypothetical protein